jgi:hypothetical protein
MKSKAYYQSRSQKARPIQFTNIGFPIDKDLKDARAGPERYACSGCMENKRLDLTRYSPTSSASCPSPLAPGGPCSMDPHSLPFSISVSSFPPDHWRLGGGGLIHGRKKFEDWGVAIGEFQFVPKQTNERIGGGVSDRRVSTRPQKN